MTTNTSNSKSTIDDFKFREFYDIAYEWLTLLGNAVDKRFLKNELSSHTDYPALTSLTDVLDAGSLAYSAVRAGTEDIGAFNYPLLAHIRTQSNTQGLVIVKDVSEWTSNDTLQSWSGITIFPDNSARWIHQDNIAALAKRRRSLAYVSGYALLVATLMGYCLVSLSDYKLVAWYALSAIGFFFSFLLVISEMGIHNQIVKKVCGTISDRGCDKILRSAYSKGMWGISVADVSLAYFGAQIVGLVLIAANASLFYLQSFEQFLSLFGIVIIALSLFTQKFVIRQWCALCLGVIVSLAGQATYAIYHFTVPPLLPAAYFFTSLGVVLFVAVPLKQLWGQIIHAKPQLAELKRWKSDAEIFVSLLQQQQEVDTKAWDGEIQIGNPTAAVQITVACNPYCGPCASMHKKIDALLEKYPDKVGASVRFIVNIKNFQDRKTEAVNLILNRTHAAPSSKTKEILSDWFEWMNKDIWLQKWPLTEVNMMEDLLRLHDEWVKEAAIVSTPTIFINGFRLPGIYTIDNVSVMMPQLLAHYAGSSYHEQIKVVSNNVPIGHPNFN